MTMKTLHQISEEHGIKEDSLYRVIKRNPKRFGAYRTSWVLDDASEGFQKWLKRYKQNEFLPKSEIEAQPS